MITGHPAYFMNQELYDVAEGNTIKEAPYNCLTPEEWLRLIHQQHAHEVEYERDGWAMKGSMKGRLYGSLMKLSIDEFLFTLLHDYLSEHDCFSRTTKSIKPPEDTLIPSFEWGLYKKAVALYEQLKPKIKNKEAA